MDLICSECGGKLDILNSPSGKIYKCSKCGREKIIKEEKVIDMSESEVVLYG